MRFGDGSVFVESHGRGDVRSIGMSVVNATVVFFNDSSAALRPDFFFSTEKKEGFLEIRADHLCNP